MLSVIMPIYKVKNHIDLFIRAIDGICAQTYRDFELLIMLDGYNHVTERYAKNVLRAKADPRIRLFVGADNVGPGVARNVIYQFASGEYVTFHDSDDYSEPDRFEKLMNEMQKSQLGVVGSHFIQQVFCVPWFSRPRVDTKIMARHTGTVLERLLDKGKIRLPFHFPSCIMTRELFEEMGGYEPWQFSSDSIFAIKLGLINDIIGNPPIEVVKETIFTWNRHNRSVTMLGKNRKTLAKCQLKQREPVKKLRKLLLAGGIDLPVTMNKAKDLLEIKDHLEDAKKYTVYEITP